MNEFVVQSIEIVFSGTGSDVTIFVEVTFQLFVDASDERINSEIKLSLMNQQWVIDILLNDVSWVTTVFSFSTADETFDFVYISRNADSDIFWDNLDSIWAWPRATRVEDFITWLYLIIL